MPAIRLSKSAREFIQELAPKEAKQVAMKVFSLGVDPRPNDCKQLKGTDGDYLRVDSGEFRIIYCVHDDTVMISDIGKRNDDEVYRRFGRR